MNSVKGKILGAKYISRHLRCKQNKQMKSKMAAVSKQQFVNFLKSLNLDLSDFSDLSFDNICEEPTLKPFLSWLCASLDNGNVLTDDEAESLSLVKVIRLYFFFKENLLNYKIIIYSGILTVKNSLKIPTNIFSMMISKCINRCLHHWKVDWTEVVFCLRKLGR